MIYLVWVSFYLSFFGVKSHLDYSWLPCSDFTQLILTPSLVKWVNVGFRIVRRLLWHYLRRTVIVFDEKLIFWTLKIKVIFLNNPTCSIKTSLNIQESSVALGSPLVHHRGQVQSVRSLSKPLQFVTIIGTAVDETGCWISGRIAELVGVVELPVLI